MMHGIEQPMTNAITTTEVRARTKPGTSEWVVEIEVILSGGRALPRPLSYSVMEARALHREVEASVLKGRGATIVDQPLEFEALRLLEVQLDDVLAGLPS